MFYQNDGEVFRSVLAEEGGEWLVSYDDPAPPCFVSSGRIRSMERIAPPVGYLQAMDREATEGQKKRREIVRPLLEDPACITDRAARLKRCREIAEKEGCTVLRVQRLFYRSLAGRALVEKRKPAVKEETQEQKNFAWAIENYYYSARKLSLPAVYDLLLLARYTDVDGRLMEGHPTWSSFRHYYYRKVKNRRSRAEISRNGLSSYQRNKRAIFGSAMDWRRKTGSFQMDETQADIYLVSRLDRKTVIGRPHIYLAVDTSTQLTVGIYVGMEAGESAVMSCLANAAMDKVEFCRKYGIEITKDQWPNEGLPGEIITDKGREFAGSRMEELAERYGMEFQSLPPFRPDGKALVEKTFDLIQQKYKPLLRGKGVIEEDARERWAVDYRSQAALTLEDFTKVVIHSVIYLNSCRVLKNCPERLADAEPVPAGLWKWHEEQGESIMIPIDREQIRLLGLPRKTANLTRKGISLDGLWYADANSRKLLESGAGKVQIAYDPEDAGQIYVVTKNGYVKVDIAARCRRYAGTSREERRAEQEKQKVRRKELEQRDMQGRIDLARNIQAAAAGKGPQAPERLNGTIIRKNKEAEAI